MQFARRAEQLSGVLGAEDLPRLAAQLSPDCPDVQYRLQGGMQAGRPVIGLEVQARVRLICQRCLGEYVESLELVREYPVARDEAELARWERDVPLLDALVADPKQGVAELVEDEILLSLPLVPRHPDDACVPVGQVQAQ
ncbi:MAG: YceD family protein [Pseudomonadota bacterium]